MNLFLKCYKKKLESGGTQTFRRIVFELRKRKKSMSDLCGVRIFEMWVEKEKPAKQLKKKYIRSSSSYCNQKKRRFQRAIDQQYCKL